MFDEARVCGRLYKLRLWACRIVAKQNLRAAEEYVPRSCVDARRNGRVSATPGFEKAEHLLRAGVMAPRLLSVAAGTLRTGRDGVFGLCERVPPSSQPLDGHCTDGERFVPGKPLQGAFIQGVHT